MSELAITVFPFIVSLFYQHRMVVFPTDALLKKLLLFIEKSRHRQYMPRG